MTEYLFRDDPYVRTVEATVTASSPEGFELDRTIFYAASGGQPGDTGGFARADGSGGRIADAVHPLGDRTRILHVLAPGETPPAVGETVALALDWERRRAPR